MSSSVLIRWGGLAAMLGGTLWTIATVAHASKPRGCSGVLPRWVAVLVMVGALAMLVANEQTARVLLMIPFGVAWVAVGYVLWSGARAPTGRAAARVR